MDNSQISTLWVGPESSRNSSEKMTFNCKVKSTLGEMVWNTSQILTHLCISVAVHRQLWDSYAPLGGELGQVYPTDAGDGRRSPVLGWQFCWMQTVVEQLDGCSDLVALHQQGLF